MSLPPKSATSFAFIADANRRPAADSVAKYMVDEIVVVTPVEGQGEGRHGLWRRVIDTVRLWHRRMQTRAELARLDHRMLRDIGYPALDAEIEARRPFWKP